MERIYSQKKGKSNYSTHVEELEGYDVASDGANWRLPSSVFGQPYISGQPLSFNRETPWYIVDAVVPVERPVKDWRVVRHFATETKESLTRTGVLENSSTNVGQSSSQPRSRRGSNAGPHISSPAERARGFLARQVKTTPARHRQRHHNRDTDASSEFSEACCEPEPGPGHYNLPSKIQDGPAFSMGSKVKSAWLPSSNANERPGPGQYDAKGPKDGPAFSMAGRTKAVKSKDVVPGPGAYYSETGVSNGPAFSLGAPRKDKTEQTPGPGDYSVQRAFEELRGEGPAFSMTGRPRPEKAQGADEPGPGDFVPEGTPRKAGPAFTFGERFSERNDKPTPGPGDVNLPSYISEGGGFSMPGRHKPPREQLHVPGPGAYTVPRRFDNGATDGPAYSLHGRLEQRSPGEGAPGPADYDALQTGMAGPAFSLTGRTKSIFDQVVDSPAPGQYAHRDRIGRDGAAFSMGSKQQKKLQEDVREYWMPDGSPDGPAFTMGGRPEDNEGDGVPGPGEYMIEPAGPSGPAFSMGGKLEAAKKPTDMPAPGEYDVAEAWKEGPAFSMGERPQDRPLEDCPGVGAYTLDSGKPNGPHYSMAGRYMASGKEDEEAPGPGQYNQSLPVGDDGPAHTFGSRLPDPRDEGVPGPGSYRVKLEPEGPAFSIGLYNSPQEKPTDLGPGRYDIDDGKPQGPCFTLGGKAKAQEFDETEHPGPGEYHSNIRKPEGPSFSLYGRAKGQEPKINLGPGQYMPQLPPDGPAITMGTKLQDPDYSLDVGPGQYDTKPMPEGPAVTIGSSRRSGLVDKDAMDMPGPGAYSPGANREDSGPAFSMNPSNRPQEKAETPGPGPGAHNIPEVSTGPAFSILGRAAVTTEERDRAEHPGPGAYNNHERSPQGPAFSLASRLDMIPDDTTPGPGFYTAVEKDKGTAFTIAPKTADYRSAHALKEAAGLPGPGDYGAPGREAKSGVSFTIRERLKGKEPQGPGPGEYHSAQGDSPSGPAYTMGEKIKNKKGCRCTGKSKRTSGRKAGSPKRSEEIECYGETPGPQDYVPYTRNEGPAFTLGIKPYGLRPQVSPAPGTYSIHTPPEGSAYTLGPPLVHGSPWADALRRAREPGPGAYDDVKSFPRPLGNAVSSLNPRYGRARVAEE